MLDLLKTLPPLRRGVLLTSVYFMTCCATLAVGEISSHLDYELWVATTTISLLPALPALPILATLLAPVPALLCSYAVSATLVGFVAAVHGSLTDR